MHKNNQIKQSFQVNKKIVFYFIFMCITLYTKINEEKKKIMENELTNEEKNSINFHEQDPNEEGKFFPFVINSGIIKNENRSFVYLACRNHGRGCKRKRKIEKTKGNISVLPTNDEPHSTNCKSKLERHLNPSRSQNKKKFILLKCILPMIQSLLLTELYLKRLSGLEGKKERSNSKIYIF